MSEPLPNIHVANASPLILLSYYLLKSIFHLCYLRPKGRGTGAILPGSYMIVRCSLLQLSSLIFLFPHHGGTKSFCPWFPCLGKLKSCLCLPTQPLVTGNFIYQSNPTGGRVPQSYTQDTANRFLETKLISPWLLRLS